MVLRSKETNSFLLSFECWGGSWYGGCAKSCSWCGQKYDKICASYDRCQRSEFAPLVFADKNGGRFHFGFKRFVSFLIDRYHIIQRVFLLTENICDFYSARIDDYNELRSKMAITLTKSEHARLTKVTAQYKRHLLDQAQIVVSTCIGAGSTPMLYQNFDIIMIEEATKDIEPACLIPILRATSDAKVFLY